MAELRKDIAKNNEVEKLKKELISQNNDDKTDFILIGTKQKLSNVSNDSLTVGSIDVDF